MRRKLSRVRWFARVFGIPLPEGREDQPGILIIQIDGLSRTQFEGAMNVGRMPFLSRSIRKGRFHLKSFYSGVPSTTPAVQGEIFYGVKAAVPAFEFLHRRTGKVFRMFDAESARTISDELVGKGGRPLLENGHSYANIYRAGASGSWYCSEDLAAGEIWRKSRPLKWLFLSIIYLPKILRIVGLALLEFVLAIVDCLRGFFARENLVRELLFVPARISICIVLREFIRFRVLLDIERGIPIVHANFLGYDEQSHRRGPGSAFAHWTLKGIDRAVRDIHHAARRSDFRDYEMIIFSDHGQEETIPYEKLHGRPFEEAVKEILREGPFAANEVTGIHAVDRRILGASNRKRARPKDNPTPQPPPDSVVVAAMGPIGHIYFPGPTSPAFLIAMANALNTRAGVPLVMIREPDPTLPIHVCASGRALELPRDARLILGETHPFLNETAEDLTALCRHENAGDIVVSGWSHAGKPISFPPENGAHGGPGSEETRGFLLLPDHLLDDEAVRSNEPVRGVNIHELVSHHFHPQRTFPRIRSPRATPKIVRVMTYNIHSCIGIDGKLRPERIARVINRLQPDIIAVQEVDVHRFRSGHHHQAEIIAELLEFQHAFHSMLEEEKEKYGIAVFSGFPFEPVKSALLTEAAPRRLREARGAIWIKIDSGAFGTPVHFINSHFGLGRDERILQASTLTGDGWLGSIPDDEPVILCGDFNSTPRSPVWRIIHEKIPDTRLSMPGKSIPPTFPSLRPVARLDHIFASPHFKIRDGIAPTNHTARIASDHLPLCVELELADPP